MTAGSVGPPSDAPLPEGFGVELDPSARELAPGLWFGGSPARIVRLTRAGQVAWQNLRTGPVATPADGRLARRLTDAGLAHPRPPARPRTPDVTVVIPAYDRPDLLRRCLAGLASASQRVIVVDDGSAGAGAIAKVAGRYGATLIRREVNGGPAAARNTALAAVTSELVAFIDSDCVPAPDWIERLVPHFADPLVAAVAPRIAALPFAPGTLAARYAGASGGLDLGGRPARVAPGSAVSYVPTAALIGRVTALRAVSAVGGAGGGVCGPGGQVFDESMRVGEDVDLVWRLHEAGWRVRYEPSVEVTHAEPTTLRALLARRFRYGTSAAPLARRHPGAVTHLTLHPWPAATVAALLAGRPLTAAVAFGGSLLTTGQTLRRADVPTDGLVQAMLTATRQTWLGTGRFGTQFAAPVLAATIAVPGGGRSPGRRWYRRAAAASLLLGPPLSEWAAGPKTLDVASFTLARIADDVAYGLGVWAGCRRERTIAPVRPAIAWRQIRQGWPK